MMLAELVRGTIALDRQRCAASAAVARAAARWRRAHLALEDGALDEFEAAGLDAAVDELDAAIVAWEAVPRGRFTVHGRRLLLTTTPPLAGAGTFDEANVPLAGGRAAHGWAIAAGDRLRLVVALIGVDVPWQLRRARMAWRRLRHPGPTPPAGLDYADADPQEGSWAPWSL